MSQDLTSTTGTSRRLDDSLEEILARWPAGPFPPLNQGGQPMPAPAASALLAKVASIIEHPVPADLQVRASGPQGPDDDSGAALAEMAVQIRNTRALALVRAREAAERRDITTLGMAASGVVSLSDGLWEDADLVNGLLLLGQYHRATNNIAVGKALYQSAAQLALELHLPEMASAAFDNLANVARDEGDLDTALSYYDKARHVTNSMAAASIIESNRADALAQLGRLNEASAAIDEAADLMRHSPGTPLRSAILLDNLARHASDTGDLEKAAWLLEEAQPLFLQAGSDYDRFLNAWNRADMDQQRGKAAESRSAFLEAHDTILALRRRELSIEHYTVDYREKLDRQTVPRHQAESIMGVLQGGLDALNATRWPEAKSGLLQAAQLAHDAGLVEGEIMALTNLTVAAVDVNDVELAVPLANQVLAMARSLGDARAEGQALWSLFRLIDTVPDVGRNLHRLDLLAQVKVLSDLLPTVADFLGLDTVGRKALLHARGAEATALGRLCVRFGADELARAYLTEAVELAPRPTMGVQAWARGNRLSALLPLLPETEAAVVVAELEGLLVAWPDDLRLAMAANQALGMYWSKTDPERSAELLQRSCAGYESLRRQVEPGPGRAQLRNSYPAPYGALVDSYLQIGQVSQAFEAAQGAKEQRVLDALDQHQATGRAVPTTMATVGEGLARFAVGSSPVPVLIDLLVRPEAIVVFSVTAQSADFRRVPIELGADRWNAQLQQTLAFGDWSSPLRLCRDDPTLQALATTLETLVEAGRPIVLIPDGPLHNLPLHALVVAGQAWCDRNAISYLAASGLLGFQANEPAPARHRAIIAGDSRNDLPGAQRECRYIAGLYATTPKLGAECSTTGLEAELHEGPVDVIHLAVHGTGNKARGRASGLLLADDNGGQTLVDFDVLCKVGLKADLVVLSGCSTAVAGPLHGRQLVGVALAAVEAGAHSVVGCLWPVDDDAAECFMTHFHQALTEKGEATVDLRSCMDAGRAAVREWWGATAASRLRDGREVEPEPSQDTADPRLDEALDWAPFVLLGQPFLTIGRYLS